MAFIEPSKGRWLLLVGKEVVTVLLVELSITTLPIVRTRRYNLSEVTDLRNEK